MKIGGKPGASSCQIFILARRDGNLCWWLMMMIDMMVWVPSLQVTRGHHSSPLPPRLSRLVLLLRGVSTLLLLKCRGFMRLEIA